jgi:Tfp pilus assembly protein PilN
VTALNLASKPFTNRTVPWLLTFGVVFVSLIGLFLVVYLTKQANDQAAVAQAEVNNLRQQEQALVQQTQAVKNSFTPDQQQALFAAHSLVDRKSFSWSKLFADLESSLPGSVKVSRIAVRNISVQSDETVAELELAVFAKNYTTITDMISSMERGGIFQAQLLSQNLQKGRGESGTEYELLVNYRPRSSYTVSSVAAVRPESGKSER